MKKLVSVVVATYNGEKYIVKQLESIRKQTRMADEVIICDDNSTDFTCKIINEYIVKYGLTGWKLIRNTDNVGFFENFIKGVAYSSGDTIYFCDQDDIWDVEKIEKFEAKFSENEEIMMIQSDFIYIDENDQTVLSNQIYHDKKGKKIFELTIFDICRFAGSGYTMAFRKQVKDTVFKYHYDKKPKIFEYHDILFGLVSACMGRVLLDKEVVDRHRLHNENFTCRKNVSYAANRTLKKQIINVENRRNRMIEILKIEHLSDEKKEVIEQFKIFNENRISWLKQRKLKSYIYILKSRKCYNCQKVVLADFLYGIGLEKLVIRMVK